MANVVLITGGSRSGKSSFAQALGERLPGPRAFVATCAPVDAEMQSRIERHREDRSAEMWHTIEEPVDLAGVLGLEREYQVVLIDCLTLWINNLMYEAEWVGQGIDEEKMEQLCRRLLKACSRRCGTILFVTNEVGLGIVPDNRLSRSYRDLVGRSNQVIAAAAHRVVMMVCGLPLELKREGR